MADASVSGTLAADLVGAATRTNQRRLLVLSGERDAGWDAAFDAVSGAGVDESTVTAVTTREGFRFERCAPSRAGTLLGTTRSVVVCDAHEGFSPNLLGQLTGVVDGGGLLVLLTPPFDEWPERETDFDAGLAVPPFSSADVTGRFRGRLVRLLDGHPGVAVVDVDADTVVRDGGTDTDAADVVHERSPPTAPHGATFPAEAYDACRTHDQARAVGALERLATTDGAVVVEADRGRGKSSAAGLAAGALAHAGADVLVTAPDYRNAREVFARAEELLGCLGARVDHDEEQHVLRVETDERGDGGETNGRGRIRFRRPATAATEADSADVVIVDEAAALPVQLLSAFLAGSRVAFCTTVHGYEGAGRGFSVRFRDRLAESDLPVTDVRLDDPIRYAAGDPVESLAFRALLLDARPPVDPLVEDATVDEVAYETLTPDALLADEHRLREAFGLLVFAHYRTEPNDLARLLDAPNLTIRALTYAGHVVSVALLAREGGLDGDTRRRMYDGERVRGNMLPDVLTSQLRDDAAAEPVGYRVVRIATHHAVRSRGLGSHLLSEVRAEIRDADPLGERLPTPGAGVDWFGVGYGATPPLVSFWRENGFSTVYLSTSRNETSGEHSAVMLAPLSPAGEALSERHTAWFVDGIAGVLSDPLRSLDADVVRAALRAVDGDAPLSLSDREWRLVVDASYGPGLYSVAPGPFREVALRALVGPGNEGLLSPREERLLVRKVLQAHPWDAVADELDFVSTGQCMKALGRAYQTLVDRFGGAAAARHRRRYEE